MVKTIRARLTLWYVSALALALVAASIAIHVLLARSLLARVDGNLQSVVTIAATSLGNDLAEGQDVADAARSTAAELAAKDQMIVIFSDKGALLAEVEREPDLAVTLPPELESAGTTALLYTMAESDEPDDRHRIAVQRVTAQPSGVVYIIMAGNSLEPVDEELQSLRRILWLVVPLMIGSAAVGGWFLARQSLAPVMQMADQARRIGGDDATGRLPVVNPQDELGRLAATFNELLDRVGASLRQQRQFMADASHELRTPVATARTAAAVALQQPHRPEEDYRETLQIVEQQTTRLTRLVEDMFLLALADAGHAPIRKSRMYLDELLADVARAARVLSGTREIAIAMSGDASAAMVGDEELIKRLFVNLLDNAVRHSPDHTTVRVEWRRRDDHYEISVSDQGRGIPEHAQAAVFERFFRADPARGRDREVATSGAGLGLPLARWIARTHGGDVVLADSTPAGSRFVVTLAINADPSEL